MNIRYHVPDMSCGHCVDTITQAVGQVAPGSQVDVDLPTHTVTVLGATDGDAVQAAIRDAGYSPTEVE